MAHTQREAWLAAAVKQLRPTFTKAGLEIPADVQVSCGWPVGKRNASARVLGQCFATSCDAAGRAQIFVSPTESDPVAILSILAHEICHAIDDVKHGHGPVFAKMVSAIGLVGRPTHTTAGDELTVKLTAIATKIGPYPHGGMTINMTKQGTRLLKVYCQECGYIARVTALWLVNLGAPICPGCDQVMQCDAVETANGDQNGED